MTISCFDDFVRQARAVSTRTIVAAVQAQSVPVLKALFRAKREALTDAVLYGDEAQIHAVLDSIGESRDAFPIVHCTDASEALARAIADIHAGKANAIMKGLIETSTFIRAIVDKERGLLRAPLLSVMGFYESPSYSRMFGVTDFAVNVAPKLEEKRVILQNAVEAFHAFGVEKPRVAVLSAVEKNSPKILGNSDAAELRKMNERGEITGCIVDGPISFDIAMDPCAAKVKGYDSPVAGRADLLVTPDINCGNVLVKSLTIFGGFRTAGLTLGASVPVVMTSRSATAEDKFYSLALSICVGQRERSV